MDSERYVDARPIASELTNMLVCRKMQQSELEQLVKCEQSVPPKAKDYGKEAETYSLASRIYNLSRYLALAGLGVVTLGTALSTTLGIGLSGYDFFLLVTPVLCGATGLIYWRPKLDDTEFSPGTQRYLDTLALYAAKIKRFQREEDNPLQRWSDSYTQVLAKLIIAMKQHGYSPEFIQALGEEYTEAKHFRKNYSMIVAEKLGKKEIKITRDYSFLVTTKIFGLTFDEVVLESSVVSELPKTLAKYSRRTSD